MMVVYYRTPIPFLENNSTKKSNDDLTKRDEAALYIERHRPVFTV
jgi:hypothetical protein